MTERPSEGGTAEKDQIKPFHAKEVGTGKEAADAVRAVLQHAQARDEAAKKRTAPKAQPIWMLPMGLTLAVLATFLIIAPPPWVVVNPIAAQAPEDQVSRLKGSMYLYINKIEAYRMANGRLPQALAEVGATEAGFDYSVTGQNYLIYATAGEQPVVFNSAVESGQAWAAREVGNLARDIGG